MISCSELNLKNRNYLNVQFAVWIKHSKPHTYTHNHIIELIKLCTYKEAFIETTHVDTGGSEPTTKKK